MSDTHRIELGGLIFIPDLSGALYCPEPGVLIVADVHFEQASSMARRGLYLPPYDTATTLDQLEQLLATVKPARVIFLGDSFHDRDATQRLLAAHLARIHALTQKYDCCWITGNHDPVVPAMLGGRVVPEMRLGAVMLRHAPEQLGEDELEIAGHLHPGASLLQRGRVIRCKCFIGSANRLILPAFGCYTGAFSITAPPFRPLFDYAKAHVWMLGDSTIHKFPARRVR